MMHGFEVLADPIRRRAIEYIAKEERTSGEIFGVVEAEFGITQSAVSQHLRVLREAGFAKVRSEGAKRCYSLDPRGFEGVESWLGALRDYWEVKLDALGKEVERGKSARF